MNIRRSSALAILLGGCALLPAQMGAASMSDDAERSRLEFGFTQAGARSSGQFRQFSVNFEAPSADAGTGRLEVLIDTASLDTRDADRDSMLRSAYFFDTDFHPAARFESSDVVATGEGSYTAHGTLTIRDTSRALALPFTLVDDRGEATGAYMHGSVTIRRLDYGVGQAEWRATTWIGNDVTISFGVRLVPEAHEATNLTPAWSR